MKGILPSFCSNNGFILICVFLSTLYVIRQHCAYNQPVYISLFHVDFKLEDIMVSRSLRQTIDPVNPELLDTPVIETLGKLTQSSLHVPDNKELSVPIAAGTFSKLQQSTLIEGPSSSRERPLSVF
jgi:hypothetical protein